MINIAICDSPAYGYIDTAICRGEVFSYLNNTYPPDTYNDTVLITLDSFVVLNVTALDTFYLTINDTICSTDSLFYGGQYLYPNTSTIFNWQTYQGCDSILVYNVMAFDTT